MERDGARSSRAGLANGAGGEGERLANGGGREGERQRQRTINPLPGACLVRVMRRVIPANVRISTPAKRLAQDCGAEFIGAVVNGAAERCRQQERRRMAPDDMVASLRELGLDRYAEPMATYLRRYREACRDGAGASSAPPAVEDHMHIDEEFMRFLAQMMDDADDGGASSPAQPADTDA
ncbi:hypothetical protein ACP70R_026304 [Stipagrostis hirtigluma subsp. patula]